MITPLLLTLGLILSMFLLFVVTAAPVWLRATRWM
jgi:hypothetical protein